MTPLFLDNDTKGLYSTFVLPQQTYQADFNYLNAWPEKMHQWEQLGYICAVQYPSPLIPAKETSRQYPGRRDFWRASFGLPEPAPSPKYPIPAFVCLLHGPGSRGSCRNRWDVSSGWWSAALLFYKVLCFTGVRFAPLGSGSKRNVLW